MPRRQDHVTRHPAALAAEAAPAGDDRAPAGAGSQGGGTVTPLRRVEAGRPGEPVGAAGEPPRVPRRAAAYAELHCLSNFSFQRGASTARELFHTAKAQGYAALAITDECSVAGMVRALEASEESGLKLIVGSEFALVDGPRLVLLCADRAGYANLCRLITTARRNAGKGDYRLTRADLDAQPLDGLLALWLPPRAADAPVGTASAATCATSGGDDPVAAASVPPEAHGRGAVRPPGPDSRSPSHRHRATVPIAAEAVPAEFAAQREELAWLAARFPGRAWIALELHRSAGDDAHLARLHDLAQVSGLPLVAAGDVHMHRRSRRRLQDVMTAIRLRRPVADCGHALFPNGERHLRRIAELAALYPDAALRETLAVAARCTFSPRQLTYDYPQELVPPGRTPTGHLRMLTEEGAVRRWPQGVPPAAREKIEKELALIAECGFEAFFLTVEDIVRWARGRGILCQGRGSAANSIVCYCLGVTSVGPDRIEMLFERFVSKARKEPPDIDVDFEHERREEVIQYVFAKYGRQRAALAATVISYRAKSAARDVARALGFGEDGIDRLAHAFSWAHGEVALHLRLREAGFDPDAREMRLLVALVAELMGQPRHLSQHVGGFVISGEPLWNLVPVENASMPDRTVIQWDKDDLEELGLLKVDCLALGMLTCLRKGFELIARHHGDTLTLAGIPEGDAPTYAMIQRAETLGTFQIESRAQMGMLPRLKPARYYDLVIQVAIVRPGPIQGDMVHPYLRRRSGEEAIVYPKPEIQAVLQKTLGVPLFQEQVMQLLIVAAKFDPGEADRLRRAMAAWKRRGGLDDWEPMVIERMTGNGYSLEYAQQVFQQIRGFGSYGFPEAHAASFALLAYVSCWLKCHAPAAYACGLLNAQPMGFYAPAQIVAELRGNGVQVRPPDVAASDWDSTLELLPQAQSGLGRDARRYHGAHALRLGLRLISGLDEASAARIVAARAERPFRDVSDLVARARLDAHARNRLADAGALRALAGHRHRAQWEIAGSASRRDLLLDVPTAEGALALRPPTVAEDTHADYATLGLTLGTHPLKLVRRPLAGRRVQRSDRLPRLRSGSRVRCAGLVILRQRPDTASGITFLTLEDEAGVVNVIVRRSVAERQRAELLGAVLLAVDGRVDHREGVSHLIAERLHDYGDLLPGIGPVSRDFH
ncbi:error-prone DNA polymerase [Coralloluteibacterium stylophorae]|uniref:Error-prone DNA polymerase n=1 Tax=Coralloluteibacterium stylophorae TaxID=1776034 RepID=A0A8J7VRX3_9GAMM|nr:error-prone DNA polymerase [Coralloluteibacterium stylophorae]MBS7455860.1 error-prone DNA polymerase [Coralloluteibacterium stylophorae]